jgi:pilus assembly protein CpaE
MAGQLEPLFASQLAGVPVTQLNRYPTAGSALAAVGQANLVFLDVSSSPDLALQLLTELSHQGNLQVLALLTGDNPDFILRCLRAGAADFLLQPFTADQFEAVLAKLARMQPVLSALTGNCKIVAVMPAKGACGATTLACNLAFYWKRLTKQRILLADLDALTGTISFLLKVKSHRSFVDVLQRAAELDDDLWRATITTVNGVDLLLAPELIADGAGMMTDPSPILNFARNIYDVMILDASGVFGPWNLNQARMANDILLVTTNELPALQATQRALSYLESNQIPQFKVHLVVNRYHRDVGLNRDVIGTALHTEVYESLPSDHDSVQKALMEGKPVASGTPLGRGLAQLAVRLAGPVEKSPPEKKAGPLTGLLNLFSKTSK